MIIENRAKYPSALPLVTVERLTRIPYGVLKQPKRRAAKGFVDCEQPSPCSDKRNVFVTGASVQKYLERSEAMDALYKFEPFSIKTV